jgi:hypothetical protein
LHLHQIADRLNAIGAKGRRGGEWRRGTVAYVLENEKYRGALEFLFTQGEGLEHVHVPNTHQAIV